MCRKKEGEGHMEDGVEWKLEDERGNGRGWKWRRRIVDVVGIW